MKPKALRALALLAAVGLGACSYLPVLLGNASIAQQAPQTTADAEKALTLAHLAYQGIGIALRNAAASGALHGAAAAQAKALYDRAGAALDAADTADAAANAPGLLAALAQAQTLLAQLHALMPQN